MNNNEQKTYRPLPWPQEKLRNLKEKFHDKINNFHFPWRKLIIFGLFVLIAVTIFLIVIFNKVPFPTRAPYDKTGFVEATEYVKSNGDNTVLENANYKLTFNNKNTTFVLLDKQTQVEWRSNPDTTTSRFLDPMVIYYSGSLGASTSMSVYEQAVSYNDFLIRLADNSIEVLYKIGGKKGVDRSDFPEIMTNERMQEKILSHLEEGSLDYRRVTVQFYTKSELEGNNVWKLKDGIQKSKLEELYTIFYEDCGYTIDDLKYDLELNGITYENNYKYFEVGVKYTLTDSGFDVKLINDSIVEEQKNPLVYIDLLPYFGAAEVTDTGYALVPDGSGALIDFNNNRSFALPYNQRVYGKDLAVLREEMPTPSEKIGLPLYGIKRNNSGFIAIAEKGAEMASILANISTEVNPYNQAYYRFNFREGELFKFSGINSKTTIMQWTNGFSTSDFDVSYKFVHEDEGSYNGMAKVYQQYLVDNNLLTKKDNTTNLSLDLTLLGGYLVDENFLGIPYKTVKTLTNTDQVEEITKKLLEDGITNLNIIYKGWSNQGLKPTFMGRIDYNSVTGSRKELLKLQQYLDSVNVNLYPEVMVNTAYTGKGFSEGNDAIRNVFGKVVKNYGYNEAILYQDNTTTEYYTLKASTYDKTLKNILNSFEKTSFQNIAFDDYGNQMYGSYDKRDYLFRSDTLDLFNNVNDKYLSNLNNVLFRNPSYYALSYANVITDLPTYATDYQIVGLSVPFYQLVLSGYIDYSTKPFNLDDKYTFNWHKMKALETASNMSMTWSYKSTIDLVETEFSYYYSTYYSYWYDNVVNTYKELNDLGIYGSSLDKHEIIKNDVTKSTYANGCEIVFNYSNSIYNYKGTIIAPNSYRVVKEGN